MFRHQGKNRTLKHNLKIASLLSFVAGIVNIAGFLSVQKLTTNVTGHFAFFVDEVLQLNTFKSLIYFFYIFFFFFGSFCSSFLVELTAKRSQKNIFILPIIIESMLLFLVVLFGSKLMINNANSIAYILLFAMGLQNSLVTKISNATVRTTHLTGLFTDLGIELSQLFFFKTPQQISKLSSTIKLRFRIISFFLIGGLVSGIFYRKLQFNVLLIAILALVLGLFYDHLKYKIIHFKRKHDK